jgi:hypothetical protein
MFEKTRVPVILAGPSYDADTAERYCTIFAAVTIEEVRLDRFTTRLHALESRWFAMRRVLM